MSKQAEIKPTDKKQLLEQLCQEMAKNPHVMSINDLIKAATIGAMWGKNINDPFVGAVLSVCLEASRRSGQLSLDLINKLLLEFEHESVLSSYNINKSILPPRYKH